MSRLCNEGRRNARARVRLDRVIKLAEPADKPGSVRRLRAAAVIPLGASSPIRSSNLPGGSAGRINASLFGLAPGGVCRAGLLPDSRCALTAPFHPYRPSEEDVGGIFLLHFPSACAAQALPGTVPCGARTFLGTGYPVTRLSGRLRQRHCTLAKLKRARLRAASFRQRRGHRRQNGVR